MEELGHKQDAVPLKTDNSTAEGIMNKTIKQKRSKAMDMRFYWLVDRVSQKMFKVYWAPGSINLADYFSKKLPASHHRTVRPIYTYIKGKSPSTIQGCVELLKQAHTAQLAQQAGAADTIRYLTVDAGKANIQFKSLNTRQTELMRLERIASAIGI